MKKTTAQELANWIEAYISNKGLLDTVEIDYVELGMLLEKLSRPESNIDGIVRCHAQIFLSKIIAKGQSEGNRKALELLKYSLQHGEYRKAVKYLHQIGGLHPSAIDAIERRIASL